MNHYNLVPPNVPMPMPGPSTVPSVPLMKCPECNQVFNQVVSLYSHSAHTHYWNILASLFMSDFLLNNGKCSVCSKGAKLKSVNAYIKHMGGKHRLINKFMTPEALVEYSKLPTTEEEYQDVQALLNMADQPERNLMKKVKEKERGSKDNPPSQVYVRTEYPPPSFVDFGGSLHPDPLHISHFMAMSSQNSFDPPISQQPPDVRKLTKKGRIRKTNPHDPYKCPECDNTFDHVSSLYTHSAGKHYYNQLVEHYKNNYMRSNGMCSVCPSRPINDVQGYVLHVGGKHKLIHQLMSPEMLLEYEKLPAKKTNAGYTTVKNSSLVNCLICGINAKRKFTNITEYKQHLSIFHFRNQISAAYLNNVPTNSTELTCSICDRQPGSSNRFFKSSYALIVHLGSKHNCILDFADESLSEQLNSFNVFKN